MDFQTTLDKGNYLCPAKLTTHCDDRRAMAKFLETWLGLKIRTKFQREVLFCRQPNFVITHRANEASIANIGSIRPAVSLEHRHRETQGHSEYRELALGRADIRMFIFRMFIFSDRPFSCRMKNGISGIPPTWMYWSEKTNPFVVVLNLHIWVKGQRSKVKSQPIIQWLRLKEVYDFRLLVQ